jgi:glucose/arabinose dehydrogenase
MKPHVLLAAALAVVPLGAAFAPVSAAEAVLTGPAAYGDYTTDAPGVRRHLTADTLPAPFATPSSRNNPKLVKRPDGAELKTLPGFSVSVFATGLQGPRHMRLAPNGDVFVAESTGGRVSVLRARPGSATAEVSVFADGFNQPFGIAFYPQKNPKWVYISNTDSVVRYPYKAGDLKASGPAEVVIAKIPGGGGHWTRDLAFSPDDSKLYVAVGSGSNVAETMPKKSPDEIRKWEAEYGKGAGWADETYRGVVLSANPDGKDLKIYATGIRNCSGLTVNPVNGDLWCTTNERDLLGDNLVPDYSTRVRPGQFYGWPWYYLGSHEDPRHAGERPDLAGAASVPDVLYQSHSAPLQMAFYGASGGGAAFPKAYDGDAFVAMHGSWNRSRRTGYKVVRVHLKNGVPTGEYEDFLTGFVTPDANVWGRPVGVVKTQDGAMLVSDDAGNLVWRVAYTSK